MTLELDEEDYDLLGYGPSQTAVAVDTQLPAILAFRVWRARFGATAEGKALRSLSKARRARTPLGKLASRKKNKAWRERPDVKERRKVQMREYMRKYRATPKGKAATRAATKKYRQTSRGKLTISAKNKRHADKRNERNEREDT